MKNNKNNTPKMEMVEYLINEPRFVSDSGIFDLTMKERREYLINNLDDKSIEDHYLDFCSQE